MFVRFFFSHNDRHCHYPKYLLLPRSLSIPNTSLNIYHTHHARWMQYNVYGELFGLTHIIYLRKSEIGTSIFDLLYLLYLCIIVRLKCDGTRAKTRFRPSPKRTSPFKSAGTSVQSTADSGGVRISVSNAGYTTFRGSVRILATHSTRQFHLHFPSRASPCAIRFQTHSTHCFGHRP